MTDLLFEPIEGLPPLAVFKYPTLVVKTGGWRSVRPQYRERTAPCGEGCPAGEDIPGYFDLLRQGRVPEAWELIRRDNPLPAASGRVCYHPCEERCNRGEYDEAISIHAIERFVGDFGLGLSPRLERIEATRGKVAVVGSGPAGLSCAYHLARRGYAVTIYEASSSVGGMLALGIPEYRLPRDVLRAEIASIERLGVDIITGVRVGPELALERLFREGTLAVFLAIGAHRATVPELPGLATSGVVDAIRFLRKVNAGDAVSVGRRVTVVGGGNSAIDAARCARRLGAQEVSILYRRSRAEMPAHASEIEAAEDEGIRLRYQVSPCGVRGNGPDTEIECVRTTLGNPDSGGRPVPVPQAGSEFTLLADTVILATGQRPDSADLAGERVEIRRDGTFAVDPSTLATSRPGVFAGGDAVSGPARVVDAIAAGKRAAQSIDRYVTGGASPAQEDERKSVAFSDLNLDYFQPAPRVKGGQLPSDTRTHGFSEVSLPLSAEEARVEAERCFSCGRCNGCDNCWLYCPDVAITREAQVYTINYDYCKGCGVCAVECPRSAIGVEKEAE